MSGRRENVEGAGKGGMSGWEEGAGGIFGQVLSFCKSEWLGINVESTQS
jgi:hypothetical protein